MTFLSRVASSLLIAGPAPDCDRSGTYIILININQSCFTKAFYIISLRPKSHWRTDLLRPPMRYRILVIKIDHHHQNLHQGLAIEENRLHQRSHF